MDLIIQKKKCDIKWLSSLLFENYNHIHNNFKINLQQTVFNRQLNITHAIITIMPIKKLCLPTLFWYLLLSENHGNEILIILLYTMMYMQVKMNFRSNGFNLVYFIMINLNVVKCNLTLLTTRSKCYTCGHCSLALCYVFTLQYVFSAVVRLIVAVHF